jgi:hypothetical protein
MTFGQLLAGTNLLGIPLVVPASVLNWTMTLLPDGSWHRQSSAFGDPTSSGDYIFRSIVDGKGRPGPYFYQWLQARGSRPFVYIDKIFP